MGKAKSITKLRKVSQTITIRIDQEAKRELAAFAKKHEITVSALMLANIRHILREQTLDFPIKHQPIPLSKIEQDARRRRVRDEIDTLDLSKIDVYDG